MSHREKLTPAYRLTTAEILYSMPGSPHLLESYLWQDYDQAPDYPELARFLAFWAQNMGGELHSIRYAEPEKDAAGISLAYQGYHLTVQ